MGGLGNAHPWLAQTSACVVQEAKALEANLCAIGHHPLEFGGL